ncbi:hypothetical protein QTP88_024313 [Uroleucon formosanum]
MRYTAPVCGGDQLTRLIQAVATGDDRRYKILQRIPAIKLLTSYGCEQNLTEDGDKKHLLKAEISEIRLPLQNDILYFKLCSNYKGINKDFLQ